VIPAEYIEGSGFGVSQTPALPAGSGGRFTAIETRLRNLGAVYYVLETRSLDPPKFRFLCRTALAGNQNVQQKFEATDTDPLAAMQQVLRQVEQWHNGW